MSLTLGSCRNTLVVAEEASCRAFSPDREGFMASSHAELNRNYMGPTLEDCQKCWWTIQRELIVDAELRILFAQEKEPSIRPSMVVWSPGVGPEIGQERVIIWASKVLQDGFEAITYRQLYDLLITAYRNMEGHLNGQRPMPLP